MTVRILGAGMAGLLAGAMFRGSAQIYEAAPSLPNNHHALLRFRSDVIANYLNIPFEAVDVLKIVSPFRNKVAEAISYSLKSNGKASLRSSVTAEGKIDRRFIAPQDFIQKLAAHQSNPITFGKKISDSEWLKDAAEKGEAVISTMPMPTLMEVLDYPQRSCFGYRHGWVINAKVSVESKACATIYYPDSSSPVIRASLTNSLLQIELVEGYKDDWLVNGDQAWKPEPLTHSILSDFGLEDFPFSFELKAQKYAKISSIPESERRRFIMWATDNYGVYSLGRFAIWKPGLLLDDVFHDIMKIQKMMNSGDNYSGRLK